MKTTGSLTNFLVNTVYLKTVLITAQRRRRRKSSIRKHLRGGSAGRTEEESIRIWARERRRGEDRRRSAYAAQFVERLEKEVHMLLSMSRG